MQEKDINWNSKFYDTNHNFVSKYGESLIPLLAPQANENILDLGCGTGDLTNQIASQCKSITGIDYSENMINEAKEKYPALHFQVEDGHNFSVGNDYDAVFSNAALHWMLEPEKPIQCVYNALKPNGRFVFEMGGHGNIGTIIDAINHAANKLGLKDSARVNYFPTIAEYASLLEKNGFSVTFAELYQRPTPLSGENGFRNWIEMFRGGVLENLSEAQTNEFFNYAEDYAREKLLNDNIWIADYVRLRMIARKRNT